MDTLRGFIFLLTLLCVGNAPGATTNSNESTYMSSQETQAGAIAILPGDIEALRSAWDAVTLRAEFWGDGPRDDEYYEADEAERAGIAEQYRSAAEAIAAIIKRATGK